jgi:hypothetical protein
MKFVSAIMLTLGTGAALMSAAVSPVAGNQDKKDTNINSNANNQVSQISKGQQPMQIQEFNGAIRVITPQKDLESAIRASEKGDILLLGQDGWYRLESKVVQQGTKVYVLGGQSSIVTVFPKEVDSLR